MSARCHATCSTDRDTGEILCGWVGAWVSACPIAEAAEAGMDEREECDEDAEAAYLEREHPGICEKQN